jgi:hypothetical protein
MHCVSCVYLVILFIIMTTLLSSVTYLAVMCISKPKHPKTYVA